MPTHAICVAAIVVNFISFWPKWMKKFVPAVLPKRKQVYKVFGLNFGHFQILGEMAKIKNPTEMVLGFSFKKKTRGPELVAVKEKLEQRKKGGKEIGSGRYLLTFLTSSPPALLFLSLSPPFFFVFNLGKFLREGGTFF